MGSRATSSLLIFALILSSSVSALGQQAHPTDAGAGRLREEIEKLEAVERDPATPPEVRELNRRFLQERRRQLYGQARDRAAALSKYLSDLKGTLTAEEVQAVERTIQGLEEESANLSALVEAGGPGSRADTGAGASAAPPAAPDALIQKASYVGAPAESRPANPPGGGSRETASPSDRATPLGLKGETAPSAPLQNPPPPPLADCSEFKANPKTFSLYQRYACQLAKDALTNKSNGDPPLDFTGPGFFDLTVILVSQKLLPNFLIEAEEARTDKQVESSAPTSGSTSLVTKGGTPAVLGFAVENGALERDVSGTTITFRGNPVGIVEALANKGFFSGYEDDSPATRFLRKTSFSFSFDTDRGRTPGVFTADKQQLSALSGRIEFVNHRDPRRSEYRDDWEKFLSAQAQKFQSAFVRNKNVLVETIPGKNTTPDVDKWRDPALQAWFEETQAELTAAGPTQVEVEKKLKEQLAKLPLDKLSPETVAALEVIADRFGAFVQGRQDVLNKVAKGTIATFEVVNKREVSAPDTTNFKGIYETSFGGRADFTFNGSLTIFNKTPAGLNVSGVRDFQFAAQLDHSFRFGNEANAMPLVLSVSAKYERMMENAFTQAGTVAPNTKGDIAVGQIKFVIPIKSLGMKFPISATFANRTELIKEKTVKGNFGFTFDLDSILARFKPF
jgi:hypothetical protein